jgi:hypothetical protein
MHRHSVTYKIVCVGNLLGYYFTTLRPTRKPSGYARDRTKNQVKIYSHFFPNLIFNTFLRQDLTPVCAPDLDYFQAEQRRHFTNLFALQLPCLWQNLSGPANSLEKENEMFIQSQPLRKGGNHVIISL